MQAKLDVDEIGGRTKKFRFASGGNRTPGSSMATTNFTTKPLTLDEREGFIIKYNTNFEEFYKYYLPVNIIIQSALYRLT